MGEHCDEGKAREAAVGTGKGLERGSLMDPRRDLLDSHKASGQGRRLVSF